MSNQRLMLHRVVLPLALILAVFAPRDASAQSNSDQPVQSAKSGVYRNVPTNESRMAATRQDAKDFNAEEVGVAIAKTRTLLFLASPAARAWVREEGQSQARREPSESAVAAAARARFGNILSTTDIDQLVQMVMMETASDAEQELHDQLAEMQGILRQKRAQREATQKMHENRSAQPATAQTQFKPSQTRITRADLAVDVPLASDGNANLDDMSEEQQLKLQMVMDRRKKALETMSNLAKKESDTANSIIGNLK